MSGRPGHSTYLASHGDNLSLKKPSLCSLPHQARINLRREGLCHRVSGRSGLGQNEPAMEIHGA